MMELNIHIKGIIQKNRDIKRITNLCINTKDVIVARVEQYSTNGFVISCILHHSQLQSFEKSIMQAARTLNSNFEINFSPRLRNIHCVRSASISNNEYEMTPSRPELDCFTYSRFCTIEKIIEQVGNERRMRPKQDSHFPVSNIESQFIISITNELSYLREKINC